MALRKNVIEIKELDGTAIAGVPSYWPIAAFPFENNLANSLSDNMVSYFQAGRDGLSASPVQVIDGCSTTRRLIAGTSDTTLVSDSGVLGGLPRYDFLGTGYGLKGSLDAALTDYSIATLVRVDDVASPHGICCIGATAATRVFLYSNADDVAIQHGTGDIKLSTGTSFVPGTWLPIVVSYKDSDKSMRVYTTSTTPLITATMTNSPPTDFVLAWGSPHSQASSYLPGEIALGTIWDTPLHSDATTLAKVITALNGLIGL